MEELYTKGLSDWDNLNGVVTHLESDTTKRLTYLNHTFYVLS